MTRQRAYQLRHLEQGLCILCPRPLANTKHCAWHQREERRIQVEYRRRVLGYHPWQAGKPGRPPFDRTVAKITLTSPFEEEADTMSRPCDHCHQVKMCKMYLDREGHPIYLCRTDARALGYLSIDNVPVSALASAQQQRPNREETHMARPAKYPPVDFATLTFSPAGRPLARGVAPLAPIHEALLATYNTQGASVSVAPPPVHLAAFLSQLRATLRNHGHKVRVAHRLEGGALFLWAEEARMRKPRKKKEAA